MERPLLSCIMPEKPFCMLLHHARETQHCCIVPDRPFFSAAVLCWRDHFEMLHWARETLLNVGALSQRDPFECRCIEPERPFQHVQWCWQETHFQCFFFKDHLHCYYIVLERWVSGVALCWRNPFQCIMLFRENSLASVAALCWKESWFSFMPYSLVVCLWDVPVDHISSNLVLRCTGYTCLPSPFTWPRLL